MGRLKQSQTLRDSLEHAFELGLENKALIDGARFWCKHIDIKMTSAGIPAQMTGLPIGSHNVQCMHTRVALDGLDLGAVIPYFIQRACQGCTLHAPNGDTSLGTEVIERHRQQTEARAKLSADREARLAELRKKLRETPQKGKSTAKLTERNVVEFAEQLFSDVEDERSAARNHLENAAEIGPELFPDLVVDLLHTEALDEEFSRACIATCVKLAQRRKDLAGKSETLALNLVNAGLQVEAACMILDSLGKMDVLSDAQLESVFVHQRHDPFVLRVTRIIRYPASTAALVAAFSKRPEVVVALIAKHILVENPEERASALRSVKHLAESDPKIVFALVKHLVDALGLPTRSHGDDPDDIIESLLARAMEQAPEDVYTALSQRFALATPLIAEGIIGVFEEAVRLHAFSPVTATPSLQKFWGLATNFCLMAIQESSLDIEVRSSAVRALECLPRLPYDGLLSTFETLLGFLALTVDKDAPAAQPKIILPGEHETDRKTQESLEKHSRQQNWDNFKRSVGALLSQIVEAVSSKVHDIIVRSYASLATKTHAELKAQLLTLLGKCGNDASLLPALLPVIMAGLTDFDSPLVRGAAVAAVDSIYRYSATPPPANILDMVVLHLQDTYVYVHITAIDVVRHNLAHHLDAAQRKQAFVTIFRWLPSHKNRPDRIADFFDALVRLARKDLELKRLTVFAAQEFFPTKDEHADFEILSTLRRACSPEFPIYVFVCSLGLQCITLHRRERFLDSSCSSRSEFLDWLYSVPKEDVQKLKTEILKTAQKLAENDHAEAAALAGVLAATGDFSSEEFLLRECLGNIEATRKTERNRETFETLISNAAFNAMRESADLTELRKRALQHLKVEEPK